MYELIKRLYRERMNREPDIAGAASWLDVGRKEGAAAMVERFMTSRPERGTVEVAFATHLPPGRVPSAADYTSYLALADVATVFQQVRDSREAQAYVASKKA